MFSSHFCRVLLNILFCMRIANYAYIVLCIFCRHQAGRICIVDLNTGHRQITAHFFRSPASEYNSMTKESFIPNR